ncbi:TonB family C-terminal domain-containing protein [Chryseolinea serpens]|uniref:TonB family C-terminal domain-containing protein n=1 Tax=Chryseolinea serpens TaxID=947013 RepID=A0A1M5NY48_9BACT|nr:TonB family protein [Chryseolinea serpens]SHG94397.1 TonB family C-terminal domain-containing protein [Chryseolinea serpens]
MADLKNDIDKYLKGELSPAEMHALEKKALNDPFLADALEGAGEIQPPQFEADLHDLQQALQQRIGRKEEKKVVSLWVWSARIAAGLAVVAVASVIIFQLTQRNKSEQLSMVQDKDMTPALPKEEPAPVPEVEKPIPSQPSIVEEKPNPIASREDRKTTSTASEPASEGVSTVELPVVELEDSEPVAKNELSTQPTEAAEEKAEQFILKDKADGSLIQSDAKKKRVAQNEQAAPAAMDGYFNSSNADNHSVDKKYSIDKKTFPDSTTFLFKPTPGIVAGVGASKPKVVTGRVTGEDGEGLPGVNVMIKGSSVGTVTNATGDYQITLQENDKLVFSYIGYTGREADTQKDKVDVEMDVDASQLSEVVVVGYEPAFDKDEERAEALELASPEGGRRAYKQYLEKNLTYPQQAIENKVEGRVTIQFTVESTGLLSNFSVLKGIGSGCDEEVIRLVRQGPKWYPTKRSNEAVRDRVKVRMKFVLPKK